MPTLDELFPTKGAIPEALQIGRGETIEDLASWFVQGDDVLTVEPRRTGKSSTIGYGALVRVHEDYGGVIAQTDLRLSGIQDAGSLAAALVDSALKTGAGTALRKEKASRILAKTRRFVDGRRARAAADITREGGALRAVQAVAALLSGDEPGIEKLRKVLAALEEEAADHERPVVVFIDEVQDLGSRWPEQEGLAVQQELERAMRQPGRLVTYAYAGSEQTAMEQLFAPDKPLYLEGERYLLPPIASAAWEQGLTDRFARDGRQIAPEGISRILTVTEGHPLRTMQVCRAALRIVRRQDLVSVTDAVIDEAIAAAKAHQSWEGRP